MIKLSEEQKNFIKKAEEGNNILVDACIGSGKTTTIQALCDTLPDNLNILYLTYNKLLKIDAKSKIKKKNVLVTNYHGFAYLMLKKSNCNAGQTDSIQLFINKKPNFPKYDVLIIDEYQDIDLEIAKMLDIIKLSNKKMQIIAVGDMKQKIYDKTDLNIEEYINSLLGKHIKLEFTKCFRLSKEYAEKMGRLWQKNIVGVNDKCIVNTMSLGDVKDFLSKQNPADVLCLGALYGEMVQVLNYLEKNYPEKYNKKTVYASIKDIDVLGRTEPDAKSAIFTTYDRSKGMEKKVCVVFDYTESYWESRVSKPMQSYEILRNIFCVASSRGKEYIIFVDSNEKMLSEETITTWRECNEHFSDVNISEMFDYKHKEHIEECYNMLEKKLLIQSDNTTIDIKEKDEMIDLSPCIGIYQEAMFFDKYNIDEDIKMHLSLNEKLKFLLDDNVMNSPMEDKVLFLVSLETKQNRYCEQVEKPYIKEKNKKELKKRLSVIFNSNENVQQHCEIKFSNKKNGNIIFSAIGLVDVIKEDVIYELKFVSELKHEHFLQLACYMIAMNKRKGILWNVKNNAMWVVSVPNKKTFLNAVIKTITKGKYLKYYSPIEY